MASEMQMHYGGTLEQALIDQKGKSGMSAEDGLSRDMYDIPPQIHGYDFQDMYNDDVIVDLAGKVIQAYHFDKSNQKLAGFTVQDVQTGKKDRVIAPELQYTNYTTYEVEPEILAAYEHTKLVGFRTSLECRTSQTIM